MAGPISRFHLFTYGASGGDRHPHDGEAAVLLLDCQAHLCLVIYAVLAQTRDAQDAERLYTWRIQGIKVKKLRNMCKSTKLSTVNSIVVLLSRPPLLWSPYVIFFFIVKTQRMQYRKIQYTKIQYNYKSYPTQLSFA